jgi:hypothetical protein
MADSRSAGRRARERTACQDREAANVSVADGHLEKVAFNRYRGNPAFFQNR